MTDTQTEKNTQEQVGKTKWQHFKSEWGGFIILLFCLFCFRSVIADWNAVPTGSMKPTIYEGDRIWVNKLSYGLRIPFTNIRVKDLGEPSRGEIVVFPEPKTGKRYIKRVIGIEGDVIEIKEHLVFLNGERINYRKYTDSELNTFGNAPGNVKLDTGDDLFFHIEEDIGGITHPIQVINPKYNPNPKYGFYKKIVIPKGQMFVMGDNRDQSSDSRKIGLIDTKTLIGKATRVAWSHDYDNYYLLRKERFFKPIDELSKVD